jgi:3-isopropylmalate dehydrogenase
MQDEARAVEKAVRNVLESGYRTGDIMEEGRTLVGGEKMGGLVAERV